MLGRLQREELYYRQQLLKRRRAEDAEVWRGVKAAEAAPNAAARRDAIVETMRKGSARVRQGIRGYRTGDSADGAWVGEPSAVRTGVSDIFRGIDDENYGAGSCDRRTRAFLEAFCPPPFGEVCDASGAPWSLPTACDAAAYDAGLRRLRNSKATSLDRLPKEAIERCPAHVRAAFHRAAVEIGTPIVDSSTGAFGYAVPPSWQRIPLRVIDKKKPSVLIHLRREIGKLPHTLKLQAGLYMPAYDAVMPNLADGQHGWTRGVSSRGAAEVASYALDHALLLRHLLIFVHADIKRFFPAMDRGYCLCAEAWFGLPSGVRDATRALYQDACMLYETDHGLADFNFEKQHMTSGYIMGCVLSTEKAKIFINCLAEAVNTVLGGDGGVRFWNGAVGGGKRHPMTICADDAVGMLTSWAAARAFIGILDEWGSVSASVFGVSGYSKSVLTAVEVGADGVPRNADPPPGFAPLLGGQPLPIMPFDEVYPHVGDPRRLNGDQSAAQAKMRSSTPLARETYSVAASARCSPPSVCAPSRSVRLPLRVSCRGSASRRTTGCSCMRMTSCTSPPASSTAYGARSRSRAGRKISPSSRATPTRVTARSSTS